MAHVPSVALQNNLLPSSFFDIGPQQHLQGLEPSQTPAQLLAETLSVLDGVAPTPTGISTSDLHEPAPQVAAQHVADPLHLHPMDPNLQILLPGSPEIFFLVKEKTKFIKNMIFKELRTFCV